MFKKFTMRPHNYFFFAPHNGKPCLSSGGESLSDNKPFGTIPLATATTPTDRPIDGVKTKEAVPHESPLSLL